MTLRKLRFTLTCLLLQKPFPHFEERKRGRSENLAQLRFDGCVFAGRTRQSGFAVVVLLRKVGQEPFPRTVFIPRNCSFAPQRAGQSDLVKVFAFMPVLALPQKNGRASEQPSHARCAASKGRSPLRAGKKRIGRAAFAMGKSPSVRAGRR